MVYYSHGDVVIFEYDDDLIIGKVGGSSKEPFKTTYFIETFFWGSLRVDNRDILGPAKVLDDQTKANLLQFHIEVCYSGYDDNRLEKVLHYLEYLEKFANRFP